MATAKFIEADQIWQEEKTIYWFLLEGKDGGTGYRFNYSTYGLVESGTDDAVIVDADGYPMTEGDTETVAVRNTIRMTDEIRKQAAA